MTAVSRDHITVCVCTFRRPFLLRSLLACLQEQSTSALDFSYSIVVVDNDKEQSASIVCDEFRASNRVPLAYYVEPEQNIALARNRAVAHATGRFVALIDDDEMPPCDWLSTLYRAASRSDSSGVLGPVLPLYRSEPPTWIRTGRFHERGNHETGAVLKWNETRTGNALIRRSLFEEDDEPFRSSFGMGGEDRDFFKRMMSRGHRFVWCAEAPVWEIVAAERCTRSFMIRRAFLRGTIPQFGALDIVKSVAAVPIYTLLLPISLIASHHVFMKILIKNCDHIGRLCACLQVTIIKDKYVTEANNADALNEKRHIQGA